MNKNDLYKAVGEISDDLIMEAIYSSKKIKRIRISKIIAAAAALIMLSILTAWAATVILSRRSSHSSIIPDYYSVPSQETLQKDIGIAPNIPKSFSNGFEFFGGHIVENEDYTEDNNVFESYKSISCDYRKDGERISLHADAAIAGNQMDDEETAEVYQGSEIKYFAYTNKLVPGDYQLTDQDKEDKKSGKYVFSYGSTEIEIREVQLLGWEYNKLNYTLCAIDTSLSKNELVQMAKEIINAQTGGAK